MLFTNSKEGLPMTAETVTSPSVDSRFLNLNAAQRDVLRENVSDVVALDADIEAKMDQQLGLARNDSLVSPLIREFHDSIRNQRDRMIEIRDALGEEPTGNVHTIKEKGATVLGFVAGTVQKLRSDSLSKALRDDYVVFSMAAAGYAMLLTTAKAIGSPVVAEAAEHGLRVYAPAIRKINEAMPGVVVTDLSSRDGVVSRSDVMDEVRTVISSAWNDAGSS
jgi:hypothetical protein